MIELNEIESKYFNLLEGKISISEFEKWVYSSNSLELLLTEEEYTDLISLNFKTPSCKYELGKILIKQYETGKFETYKMFKLLDSIIFRDHNEGKSLQTMYHLYCNGYYFLEGLGLGLGLYIEVPNKYNVEFFEQLNDQEKKQLVDSVYPEAKILAKELREWLISGQIILTGTKEKSLNRWNYIDNRSKVDKVSRVWKSSEIDLQTGVERSRSNKLMKSKRRKKDDKNMSFINCLINKVKPNR